ncbi:MAG: hypothetical protein ACYTXT_40985 [Nostoc sp.]
MTGITHNDTNSSYPEGTQAMREAGTILIQKFTKTVHHFARVKTLERIYELEFNLGNKAGDTQSEPNKLSPMAQKLYEYLTRTERIEADVREFKGNFKVNGERFTVEQIKGWMYEIVGASLADWIGEGVIKLNQI